MYLYKKHWNSWYNGRVPFNVHFTKEKLEATGSYYKLFSVYVNTEHWDIWVPFS